MNNDYPTVQVRSDDWESMLRIKIIAALPIKQRIAALEEWQREQQEQKRSFNAEKK